MKFGTTMSCGLVVALALAFAATVEARAQQAYSGRHSLGVYTGFTDRDDIDFTIGADYEYRPARFYGYGVVVEHTPDAFGDRSATVALGTLNIYPLDGLRLTGGLGAEFTNARGGDEFRARLGAGYDLVQAGFILTPRAAVDFGDRDASVSFGATLRLPF